MFDMFGSESKLNFYGKCNAYDSLFSVLKGYQISLSGESAIKTISMVLNDKTFHHRENVVDALIVYNNKKYAVELLRQKCPEQWEIDIFCGVKAMIVEKETEQVGKFSEYKLGVPMIVLRIK